MTDPIVDALLPPAILAILTALFFVTGRRRLTIGALVGLILFSVEGVPHLLITPLLLGPPSETTLIPGAIVVLAAGRPEWLDPSRTVPSMETLKRLRTAAALHRRTGLPILVSGSRAPDGGSPVAAGMALSLNSDFSVPTAWQETASTNLWQSADASAAILHAAGIGAIYLVGQAWELRLSGSVFTAAGLHVTPEAVPYRRQRALDWTALVAFTPTWLDSAVALREWAGLACQATPLCVAWMKSGLSVRPDPS
ncbi:MAG: YdcF family protein [Pseudomonadota bacterium]|nr:YdcF family protein [Pseudomonadota bacterium]